MAEPRTPLISDQRIVVGISILIVVIVVVLFFGLRSCGVGGSNMTVIYSDLDLSDAAKVVARLKELKIPYEIRDKGTAVAVAKSGAASARLGLAEKNLPNGGVVGWEIFNETKMGATDFDRRIQLIRAISGELSRTIRKIDGVQDARVQIVLPETRLFEIAKAPVTASVLLRLYKGSSLKTGQIRGIIYLVASSVENLKPDNVTVVDDSGKILSDISTAEPPRTVPQEIKEEVVAEPVEVVNEVTKEATAFNKELLIVRAKKEYERQLSSNCQKIINKFTSPNSVIAQVNVEFGTPKTKTSKITRLKISDETGNITAQIKKLTIVVLVDNKLRLTSELKKNIYKTLSVAVPYDKKRGDRIVIRQVPFRAAVFSTFEAVAPIETKDSDSKGPNYFMLILFGTAVIFTVVIFFVIKARSNRDLPYVEERGVTTTPTTAEEATDSVLKMKEMAETDPEKVANLLKQWLTEEK